MEQTQTEKVSHVITCLNLWATGLSINKKRNKSFGAGQESLLGMNPAWFTSPNNLKLARPEEHCFSFIIYYYTNGNEQMCHMITIHGVEAAIFTLKQLVLF